MTDEPRRRAQDKSEDEPQTPKATDQAEPRRKRSARDFFHRFRHPLLGLGMAGVAAPLAASDKAVEQPPEPASEAEDERKAAEVGAPEKGADLEDKIAGRIAETRATEVRNDTVRYAIDRYGISQDLAEDIYDAATRHGIEPKLAYGLVKTESAFRHDAISHVGARGLTQVMPRTARWLMPGTAANDLYDRKLNLNLGFRYLNQLIDKYGGDTKLALLAYNRGPGTVDRILKRGGNPDNGYARKVIDG
ncbi:MAG: lytic transglycosylase domain-containing protein [Longimicrobiales bacterium]